MLTIVVGLSCFIAGIVSAAFWFAAYGRFVNSDKLEEDVFGEELSPVNHWRDQKY